MSKTYKALWLEETSGQVQRSIVERKLTELPNHPVLIQVHYSSLNYKDALSCIGNRGVTKDYPHQPGIDAAGVVVESNDGKYKEGDQVLVTGYDLGQNTPGGLAEYIRVPAEWIVPLPENLTMEEAMVYGTAGFTAGQALMHLSSLPMGSDILVTGATGGVSSMGILMLAKMNYVVHAVTGKADKQDWLEMLGATKVLSREAFLAGKDKALAQAKWDGVMEACGGKYLEAAIKSVSPRGIVTNYGMVDSEKISLTVFPFILRGVSLVGINSADCPYTERMKVWEKLSTEWKPERLHALKQVISLKDVSDVVDQMLAGNVLGRTVVKIY